MNLVSIWKSMNTLFFFTFFMSYSSFCLVFYMVISHIIHLIIYCRVEQQNSLMEYHLPGFYGLNWSYRSTAYLEPKIVLQHPRKDQMPSWQIWTEAEEIQCNDILWMSMMKLLNLFKTIMWLFVWKWFLKKSLLFHHFDCKRVSYYLVFNAI